METEKQSTCPNCGTVLADDELFCHRCGQRIEAALAPAVEASIAEPIAPEAVAEAAAPEAVAEAAAPEAAVEAAAPEAPMDVPTEANPAIAQFNAMLEKKKKAKKKRLIALGSVAGAAALAAVVIFVLLPLIFVSLANKAFDSQDYAQAVTHYENSRKENDAGNIDRYHYAQAMVLLEEDSYEQAANTFATTNNLLDSEERIFACGAALIESGNFNQASNCFAHLTSSQGIAYKNYCDGMVAFKQGQYSAAIANFAAASNTVPEAAAKLPETYYKSGLALFKNGDYTSAARHFQSAGEYEDAKTYVTACTLMQAEDLRKEGKLNEAQKVYKTLPKDFTFNGISVEKILKNLDKVKSFTAICGEFSPTKNYIETRNVYKRTGSWDSWYIDAIQSDQRLTIYCYLNDDGTITIRGTVSFYRFTNYSSLSAYCDATKTSRSFTVSNVKSIPKTIKVDSYTTLTYSSGKFNLTYSITDNYSSYFYNRYKTTATFGKKLNEY